MASTETRIAHRENGVGAAPRPVVPPVDVYENADELLLVADLPGVSQEDLSIELDRGELRLEAHHGANGTPERSYRRVFTVPDGIDGDNVRAELKNGVLNVHLPKAPTIKPRKISVQSG